MNKKDLREPIIAISSIVILTIIWVFIGKPAISSNNNVQSTSAEEKINLAGNSNETLLSGKSNIATINYQQVIQSNPDFISAQEKMNVDYQAIQKELQSNFDATPQEKQKSMMEAEQKLRQKEAELFKPVKDSVDKIISDTIQEKGFTAVLDKRAVIIGGTDITKDVLQKQGVSQEKIDEILKENLN